MAQAKKRGAGRPRKSDGPAFPADQVDKLLVYGEQSEDGKVRFPSMRDIARRFGVAHSVVSEYAKRHDCIGRRQRVQAEARDLCDRKVAESVADAMVVEKQQMDKLACEFIGEFGRALREGRVRADSFADFNQAVRLVQLLRGEADARQEHLAGITLERLGERHRVWLETMARPPAALTGQVQLDGQGEQESPSGDAGADDNSTLAGCDAAVDDGAQAAEEGEPRC